MGNNKQKNKAATVAATEAPLQLTHDPKGHCLNTTQCFSPDDLWLAYDTRNDDTKIGSTGSIEMVNVRTGEIRLVYKTANQTEYGPGVGAAAFNPLRPEVLFIHGIRNADAEKPYGFTRRTGVMVETSNPGVPIFMDARDVMPPFTPGALRGGTHAHTWSGDGQWISFTYNDDIIAKLAAAEAAGNTGKSGASSAYSGLQDLRTVGIMYPGKSVTVPEDGSGENNSGRMFTVVTADVTEHPRPGSDDISRAFDEGWIGTRGYIKPDGSRQEKAVAFQGNVTDEQGHIRTEVFVADLPADLSKARPGLPLEGTANTRPNAPQGVRTRRITRLAKGIASTPRHWLHSTPDGSLIGFLQEDDKQLVQLFGVSPNGGEIRQLTFQPFSIQGPFNFSPDGRHVAYTADNSIFITEIGSGQYTRLTEKADDPNKPVGAVNWSHKGDMLAWNAYMGKGESFLQVFIMKVEL